MQILISNEKSLREIQQEFQSRFPFLKIEFFQAKAKSEAYTAKDLLDPASRITDVCKQREVKHLTMEGSMTVSSLEKQCMEILGIHLEVFRKSGKVWLKTSTTDNWTLDEQNQEASESEAKNFEKPEESDYHEQE